MDPQANRVEPSRAIGEALADRRRSRGLSVDDVAASLKFMPRQLEALERGAFDRLPGPAFVRGMIRSYARALDLDAAPLLAQLAPVANEPIDSLATLVNQPVPISDRSHGMNSLYGALSVVIALVIGAVAWEWWMQKDDADRLTFVRPVEPRSAPEPAPVAVAAAQMPALPTAAPVESPPVPVQEPARDGIRRIELRFEGDAWVQIRGGDGRVLMSRLNAAGSERMVEGRPPFQVVIGNARHVRLNYAEKAVDLAPHVRSDVARLTLE